MINKIILISSVRVLGNDFNRFNIQKFSNNIDFELWDLSFFTHKKKILNSKSNKDFKTNNILKQITNEKKFLDYLQNLDENTIIIDLFEIIFNRKYQKIIFKNKVKTMKFNLGPIPSVQRNTIQKLYEFINNYNYYVKNILKKYLLNKYFAPNYYVCVSKFDIPSYVNSETIIIKTHSFDYDKIVNKQKPKINFKSQGKKLAIYLDEGVYGHPDISYNNLKNYCDEKIFFTEIHNFFNYLSNNNYEILIAGHPKINYSKKLKKLFKYKIIEYSTNDLIYKSDIVLTHMSTSINFAVIYKKKIIHLDSSSYNRRLRDHIISFSNCIGSTLINLKDSKYKYILNEINLKKYNDYLQRYITPFKDNNKKLWQIVVEKI